MIFVVASANVCVMTMVNDTTTTLAERLVLSRRLAGLEQAEIAQRLGVARTTVSAWERGLTEPSASSFVGWATETGQPIEWLAAVVKYTPRDLNPEPTD